MIVEFGADWCGPCGLMEKNITDLQKCMDDVIILHSDVVKDPKSADEYEIDTVPTFKFVFHNQTINDTVRGMYSTGRGLLKQVQFNLDLMISNLVTT